MRKRQVDYNLLEPKEFEAGDNKKYEIKAIINSMVYGKEAYNQMPGLYYFVLWKGYLEEESTKEPFSVGMHLWKLINTFHKEHLIKPIAISLLLDSTLPIARPTVPKK